MDLPGTDVDGRRELRFTLPAAQAELLGEDVGTLADEAVWLMWAVHALRTGAQASAEEWYDAAEAMHSLSRHLEGAMSALMRNHVGTDNGLSIAELARATGVSRSTAQTRRESVLSRPGDADELWATGPAPAGPSAAVVSYPDAMIGYPDVRPETTTG